MPIKFRVCTGPCGRSLPHTEFWRDAKQADGRMTRCPDCVKAAREDRAQRRANGEIVPTISDELRRERSERAKQMHAEGRFGGAEFGRLGGLNRPRRVSDVILDFARNNSDLIEKALEANLRAKNKSQRMRAVEFVAKHELDAERVAQAARGAGKLPEEMTMDELRAFVQQGIRAQIERGEIDLSTITLPDSAVQEVA